MKAIVKFSIVILFALFIVNSKIHAQTLNFSGNYNLNKQKTQFGAAPEWVLPKGFTVNQQGSNITIIRFLLDSKTQGYRDTLQLSFDGKIYQNYSYTHRKQSFSLEWAADQKTFTITMHAISDDGDPFSDITEGWSLSDDGKTLLVDRSVNQVGNGLKYSIKAFYAKN